MDFRVLGLRISLPKFGNVSFLRRASGDIEIRICGPEPGWVEHADIADVVSLLTAWGSNGRAASRKKREEP